MISLMVSCARYRITVRASSSTIAVAIDTSCHVVVAIVTKWLSCLLMSVNYFALLRQAEVSLKGN